VTANTVQYIYIPDTNIVNLKINSGQVLTGPRTNTALTQPFHGIYRHETYQTVLGLLSVRACRNNTQGVSKLKQRQKGTLIPCTYVIKHYAIEAYGGVAVQRHILDLGTKWT
jgi:hypothetical protein